MRKRENYSIPVVENVFLKASSYNNSWISNHR